MNPVFAEQAEVHVANVASVPMIKEMLAVWLDLLEHGTVDPFSVGGKSTLWAGHLDRPTAEESTVIFGDFMDRMSFRHRKAP